MLGIFKSKARNLQVGIDFLPTGVAAIAVNRSGKNPGWVQFCDFLPSVGAAEQAKALQQWVDRRDLKDVTCNALIAKHDVQIFQIERPAVDDSEMLQAVGWKLKDLISYDISAAVVDVFDMPPSSKTPQKQINAVVANAAVVGAYVERIRDSGLELNAIDIHDLAGKNFSQVYGITDKTFALLHFGDNDGLLNIYHDGDLYVSRDLKLGVLDMQSDGDEEGSLYDRLLLELQRSMDYFESFYGLGQVQELLIFPRNPALEKMASYLQNYVAYELDFATIRHADDQVGDIEPHCFSAYCAALRGITE
jgi:MSHA biogenesis protein MshI